MIEFFYFLLDFGDLLFMRRWYSSCACFMPLSPVTVLTVTKGSSVETGDDLFQVFALLDYQCLVRLMLMRTTNESWWSKWPLELDTVGAEVLSS